MMDPLKSISESLVQRYSNRYRELGDSIRTLGWGSTEQQRYRFAMSLSLLGNTAGKKIVDVGCGFGDFFRFLIESGVEFESYLGVDINEDLLGQARQKCNDPRATFERINILTEPPAEPLGDILVMFGILNFHLKEKMNNLDYTRLFVKNAFSLARDRLIFDFISTHRTPSYPAEDFIYYHDPVEILAFCFELTPRVSLKHDYLPIPQREGMIALSHSES